MELFSGHSEENFIFSRFLRVNSAIYSVYVVITLGPKVSKISDVKKRIININNMLVFCIGNTMCKIYFAQNEYITGSILVID